MTEKLLITKLIVSDTTTGKRVALLFSSDTRLRFPSLTLFDLTMLADVGIDPNALKKGEEVRKRFWAHWQTSQKENQRGNLYKDVVTLSAFEGDSTPQPTTDLDPVIELIQDVLDELHELHAKLDLLLEAIPVPPRDEADDALAATAGASPDDPFTATDNLNLAIPTLPPPPPGDTLPSGQHGAMTLFYQIAGPALATGKISYSVLKTICPSQKGNWIAALAQLQQILS
jgi:hypothetical protein